MTEFTESELACERSGVLTERLNSEGFEVRRGNIEGRRVSSVTVPAEELADVVWSSLNEDNKVSLLVRAVPLDGSEATEIIINKNV